MQFKFKVKVAAKRLEALDVHSYDLVSVDGEALPKFEAGAHVDVFLPDLPARQYSLCNDPQEGDHYTIGVLRAENSRGVSRAMYEDVQVGDLLEIGAPKNHFPLVAATRTILLAGGIGITPLLAMAERLYRTGAQFELNYACRTRSRAAFLDRVALGPYADRCRLWFDDVSGQSLDLKAVLAHPAPGTHLYICGPTGLLEAARSVAAAQGWPASHVHFEYFSGEVQKLESDCPFDVEIAETGEVIHVDAGTSALQALHARGVDIPCSCEEGVCGMCQTNVVTGTPDHRDHYLTEEERARNDTFMPCCSRSKTQRIVISL